MHVDHEPKWTSSSLKVEELHVLCCESGSGQARNFWQDPDPENNHSGFGHLRI
jgi:hypothetical protein